MALRLGRGLGRCRFRWIGEFFSYLSSIVSLGLDGVYLGSDANAGSRDREWQKWPVTIITGAYLGYAVGKTVGGLPFVKGRRITFE